MMFSSAHVLLRSIMLLLLFQLLLSTTLIHGQEVEVGEAEDDISNIVRFATYNAALNRNNAGDLINDLSTPNNTQAMSIAEIIQIVRPDVLLINEFDYDEYGENTDENNRTYDSQAALLFQENYLQVSQNGQEPIDDYDYVYAVPCNTGIPSGVDLDNNNSTEDFNDAFGFGAFPGQYAFVIFSRVRRRRCRANCLLVAIIHSCISPSHIHIHTHISSTISFFCV
jgi:hypothetical protein